MPDHLHVTNDVLVLEAGRTQKHYWADAFRYRDLFAILARRDVAVRYKQTAIGVLWAVLRPIATMLVFTLVFGRIANLPSEGVPYSVLVFSGMLPWFFFASSVSESSGSLIANANLLSKVYFPRILVPASAVLVAAVDFLIAMSLLIFLMQFGLYVSPVGFVSTVIPEKWALVYGLNPMVGVIDVFRWAILGDRFPIRLDVQ